MSVTVGNERHRNPSGLHNKVNWILVQSEYDSCKIDELRRKTLVFNPSWENAFHIACLIATRQFNLLQERFPQHWRWCRKYVNSLREVRLNSSKTWLQEKVDEATDLENSMIAGSYLRSGASEVCKEIMRRFGKDRSTISIDTLKDIISDLGVNLS